MTYERRGGRPRVYWYLAIVFALQSATPSLSLPLGTISSGEKSCLIVHANPSSVQLTPRHVVRLLDQRHVQNQFVLELPLKEVAVREEAERAREGNEQVNSDQDTSSVVCRGEWPYTVSPPNALMLYGASYFLDSSTERSGELHHAVS